MDRGLSGDIEITRRNLVEVICLIVHTVIEFNCQNSLEEDNALLRNLITALEHIFYHGLNVGAYRRRLFRHPWPVLSSHCKTDSSGCINTVALLCPLAGDFTKLRMWIKVCLVKHCFQDALTFALQTLRNKKMYSENALLLSSDFERICNSSRTLDLLNLNFDLKIPISEFESLPSIDYTPFLTPSHFSGSSDVASSHSSFGDCKQNASLDWRLRFVELRNTHDNILKRLHQLEDDLRAKQDMLNSKVDELVACHACQRDMESQILELQVQLTLYHEQCVRQLKAAGVAAVMSPPPTLKQWREISRRRRQLVIQAELDRTRIPSAESRIHVPSVELGYSSVCDVDQGIDALTYENTLADSNSTEAPVESDSHTPCSSQSQVLSEQRALTSYDKIKPSSEGLHQMDSLFRFSTYSDPLNDTTKVYTKFDVPLKTVHRRSTPTKRFGLQRIGVACNHLVLNRTPSPRIQCAQQSATTDHCHRCRNQIPVPHVTSTPSGLIGCPTSAARFPWESGGFTVTKNLATHRPIDDATNQLTDKPSDHLNQNLLDSLISDDLQATSDCELKMSELLSREYYSLTSPPEGTSFGSSIPPSASGTAVDALGTQQTQSEPYSTPLALSSLTSTPAAPFSKDDKQ